MINRTIIAVIHQEGLDSIGGADRGIHESELEGKAVVAQHREIRGIDRGAGRLVDKYLDEIVKQPEL